MDGKTVFRSEVPSTNSSLLMVDSEMEDIPAQFDETSKFINRNLDTPSLIINLDIIDDETVYDYENLLKLVMK